VKFLKTTIITAYELLKGAAISSKPQENLKIVKDLLSNIIILTLDYGSCEEASEIYSKLRVFFFILKFYTTSKFL